MHALIRAGAAGLLLLLASACHADDLTERAVRALKKVDATLDIKVKDDNELNLSRQSGDAWTIYLDNLRKDCGPRAAACDALIAEYAGRMVRSGPGGSQHDLSLGANKVYPVLRRPEYAAQSTRLLKDAGKGILAVPFTTHAEQLFALDGAESIRYVTVDEAEKAGKSADALMADALGNVAAMPPLKTMPLGKLPGVFALMGNDSLGNARMFDAALWDRLEKEAGGPLAVAVPTRDWMLYTRLDDPAKVQALHTLATRIAAGEAYGVTGELFRRDKSGWVSLDVP